VSYRNVVHNTACSETFSVLEMFQDNTYSLQMTYLLTYLPTA